LLLPVLEWHLVDGAAASATALLHRHWLLLVLVVDQGLGHTALDDPSTGT
jgi:hypothetical protein